MGNSQQKPPALNPQTPPPPPNQEQSSSLPSTFTCEICIEPVSQPARNFNSCAHPFCSDCMIKYIEVKLDDSVAKIKCPAPDCHLILDPLSCRPLIPPQLFDKWCDVLCQSAVLGLHGVYCPNRDCSALVVNECGGNVKKSKCPNCKKLFCFKCGMGWHAGFSCEESGQMSDRSDVAFGVLAERKNWMRCPTCRHFIELSQGCSIVHCRCKAYFCYKCGRTLGQCSCDAARRSRCRRIFESFTVTFVLFICCLFFILYMDSY